MIYWEWVFYGFCFGAALTLLAITLYKIYVSSKDQVWKGTIYPEESRVEWSATLSFPEASSSKIAEVGVRPRKVGGRKKLPRDPYARALVQKKLEGLE